MGLINFNKVSGNEASITKVSKTETEQTNLSTSVFGKVGSLKDCYKVSKVETVVENGKKVETAYNSNGNVVRTSVFVDRNGDGNFERSEAISVKFYNVMSRASNTKEYKDTDNDGYYNEIIESDWSGNETIHKLNNKIKAEHLKMSNVYGSENDASAEWFS